MVDLLPCPFCGGKAEWCKGRHGDGSVWRYIACSDCEAMAPYPTDSITAWNTRHEAAKQPVVDDAFRHRVCDAVSHELAELGVQNKDAPWEITDMIMLLLRRHLAAPPTKQPVSGWPCEQISVEEFARRQARQPVGWQPISTAPRDGTEFIGWEPQTEYQKEGGYAEQGNYDLCTWRDDGFYSESSLKPTHWIPTPLPPTKE